MAPADAVGLPGVDGGGGPGLLVVEGGDGLGVLGVVGGGGLGLVVGGGAAGLGVLGCGVGNVGSVGPVPGVATGLPSMTGAQPEASTGPAHPGPRTRRPPARR